MQTGQIITHIQLHMCYSVVRVDLFYTISYFVRKVKGFVWELVNLAPIGKYST